MGIPRHHHYEDDELWLSVDEVIELVRLTVQHLLASPDQRLGAPERDEIRGRLEARRRVERKGPDRGGRGRPGPSGNPNGGEPQFPG